MATGRIELTPTSLTRYFGVGNKRRLTLAWNDAIYSTKKLPFGNRMQLELTSEAGKYRFYIPDTIENFSELQDIIYSRATQYYKDVKRDPISIS